MTCAFPESVPRRGGGRAPYRRAGVEPFEVSLPLLVEYLPFFAAAVYAHDWPRERQKRFVGALFAIDAALLVLFGPVLGWI